MHEMEKKLCVVGLWCIQMKSCDRPTMSEVTEMLEGGRRRQRRREYMYVSELPMKFHDRPLMSEVKGFAEKLKSYSDGLDAL
ncbi:hypothetical protein GUJ93_ZPchr0013g35511 [Zizania palustris]|uniref:Uncharacterized protein n=1 Tax=Zizania palustris TaxID=103762 RepID=A0A8J6BUG6_ZIZPA|nr:hypothetical protein GUJ93_ZPchr0013g35511 [Zizania palustris]